MVNRKKRPLLIKETPSLQLVKTKQSDTRQLVPAASKTCQMTRLAASVEAADE